MRAARDVTARGVRMRVVEAGEGRGPPLVLVHGFWATHLDFDDVIDRLATRFHVIVPDLPGFGDSEKPSPARYPYGVETFAEAVADLIAAYGLGRAFVVGHALGGAIGITLAAHHPELVNRLVLVDALCYPTPLGGTLRAALWPFAGGFLFKQLFGRRRFRRYYKDEVFSKHADVPWWRVERFYEAFNTPPARESAYAVLRGMLDTRSTVARVTRIRRPTLVVWGREDRVYPAHHALKLVREVPDARLELFDAGHAPHAERPEEFALCVRQFCEGKRG
jgi:pimeloyl-ACP methyl ester carboxylesterase